MQALAWALRVDDRLQIPLQWPAICELPLTSRLGGESWPDLYIPPVQANILSVIAPVQILAPLGVVVHSVQVAKICKLFRYLLVFPYLHRTGISVRDSIPKLLLPIFTALYQT